MRCGRRSLTQRNCIDVRGFCRSPYPGIGCCAVKMCEGPGDGLRSDHLTSWSLIVVRGDSRKRCEVRHHHHNGWFSWNNCGSNGISDAARGVYWRGFEIIIWLMVGVLKCGGNEQQHAIISIRISTSNLYEYHLKKIWSHFPKVSSEKIQIFLFFFNCELIKNVMKMTKIYGWCKKMYPF